VDYADGVYEVVRSFTPAGEPNEATTVLSASRQKRPFVHGPAHLFGRLARRLDRRSNLNASVKNAIVFASKSEECQ
jgi:hypothetical protein